MKKISLLFVFSFFLMNSCLLKAQSIQLFTEDFQTGGSSFTLNGSGTWPNSNTGNNQWIVNSQYSGVPTYPNTMREDSTYSGTIGSAPFSNYLHIYDVPSGISNCNYDPSNQSDRFAYMTNGLCTLGMDSVHFSFFYLCEGSATAYGKLYYSADNGPWIQTGQSQYNNKYKWKYENITNTAFDNVGNLRFGFRWENNNGAPPNTEAFAIDDINIVASYNNINPITINVDSVTPNPVCQGTYMTVYYSLSDTLCDGTYKLELSTSTGTFPSSYTSWVLNAYYPQTTGTIGVQLPNGATPGGCYKFRVTRMSPPPVVTGIASACFTIDSCPNVITTLQPVVTKDTNAVCIGSAIDIPFFSTGVYLFNTYTAQLSDSNGVFPSSPTVLGTSFNSNTYDPNLPPYQPGSVSGQVPVVPPGCNYFIRVVSDGPAATGSVWGPFCIGQCDITTNNKIDLNFCSQDCSVSLLGLNSLIPVDVNSFNNTAVYNLGNIFATQLMSAQTFGQIGANGILGSVASTHDTTLNVHIPCTDSLSMLGIPLGMNYMRVIGTNSSVPDNALGSLIRVTIGALRSTPQIITSYDYGAPYDFTLPYPWIPTKDTFCAGSTVMLLFDPYNYSDNSTYKWICSGINGGNPFVSPSGANSNSLYVNLGAPGMLYFKIQETNNGCVGPWSPLDSILVLGTPSVQITGPTVVCQGDTNTYQVPFMDNTYYNWTVNNGLIVDTANNVIDLKFTNTSPPSYIITIHALNQCGAATATKSIQVRPYPTVNAGHDTTVCINQPVLLSTPSGTGYSYSWSDGTNVISSTRTTTVSPGSNSSYTVTVTGPGGCKKKDSVKVHIRTPTLGTYSDSTCPNGDFPIQLIADSLGTYYSWTTGATTQQILVTDTGTYVLTVNLPNAICPRIITYHVLPDPCPAELTLPNVFSPNGDGNNDFFKAIPLGEWDVYDIDKFDIKIYNRWGQLIFESTDPFFKWDGNNKEKKPAPDGVYYFIAEISGKSDKPKTLTGFITLTR